MTSRSDLASQPARPPTDPAAAAAAAAAVCRKRGEEGGGLTWGHLTVRGSCHSLGGSGHSPCRCTVSVTSQSGEVKLISRYSWCYGWSRR